jgi:hypothetical protein
MVTTFTQNNALSHHNSHNKQGNEQWVGSYMQDGFPRQLTLWITPSGDAGDLMGLYVHLTYRNETGNTWKSVFRVPAFKQGRDQQGHLFVTPLLYRHFTGNITLTSTSGQSPIIWCSIYFHAGENMLSIEGDAEGRGYWLRLRDVS